jgi:hypothetical protein
MKNIPIAAALVLLGCAPVVHTEYITVAVPVRCETEKPARPVKQANLPLSLIDMVEYVRLLEIALDTCLGGK